MSTSPNIGLPFLAAQQLQPEITHNEAILLLQLMQVGVISSGSNTAPGSPTDGDSYIVGSSPTGAMGRAGLILWLSITTALGGLCLIETHQER